MVKSRKGLIAIATVTVILLLLTGTFAWQQVISKTNEFIGTKNGGTLHDDFNPNTGAKDVYVENPNETELFVRVKLNEAMDITNNTWRPGINDWLAHTYVKSAEDCGQANEAEELFHNYFTWVMGGQKYYMPSDGTQQVVQDTTVYDGSELGVRLTPDASIINIADYLAMDEEGQLAFIGWIYDTDGYAYWSQPLGNGDITGLLLHKVNISEELKDTDYYYAIDVIVEAVDIKDIPMWTQGVESVDGSGVKYSEATANGKRVINMVITKTVNND